MAYAGTVLDPEIELVDLDGESVSDSDTDHPPHNDKGEEENHPPNKQQQLQLRQQQQLPPSYAGRTSVAIVAALVVLAAIIVVDFFATQRTVIFVSATTTTTTAPRFFYRPEFCGFDTAARQTLTLGTTRLSRTASAWESTNGTTRWLVPFLSGEWRDDVTHANAGYMVAAAVVYSPRAAANVVMLPFNGCGGGGGGGETGQGTNPADLIARVASVHAADGTPCTVAQLTPTGTLALHCWPEARVHTITPGARRVLALVRGPTEDTLVLVLSVMAGARPVVELRFINRRGEAVQPATRVDSAGYTDHEDVLVFWGVARQPTVYVDTLYVALPVVHTDGSAGIRVRGTINLGHSWSAARDIRIDSARGVLALSVVLPPAGDTQSPPHLVALVKGVPADTATTLVSARTCQGGTAVRPGCNTSVVLATACVPDPNALASACVRVRTVDTTTNNLAALTPLVPVTQSANVTAAVLDSLPAAIAALDLHRVALLEPPSDDGSTMVTLAVHGDVVVTKQFFNIPRNGSYWLTTSLAARLLIMVSAVPPPARPVCVPGANPRQSLCSSDGSDLLDETRALAPVGLVPIGDV